MNFNVDDLEGEIKVKKETTPREFRLQVATISHVTGRIRRGKEVIQGNPAFRGIFVTHVYAGRSKEDGFFLQTLGVVAGVADLLFIWKGGFGFIEMKTQDGHLNPAQKKFKGFCIAACVRYEIARSVRDVHNILIKWGHIPLHNAINEPDLRSDTQKKQDGFNFFKRPE